MGAGKQADTSIAYAARLACRAIAQASQPGRSLPRVLVAAQHGHGSIPDRNIVSMIMLDDLGIHERSHIWMSLKVKAVHENVGYLFISANARGAQQKWGVKSISLLAVKA
jgi:hypothetical protein